MVEPLSKKDVEQFARKGDIKSFVEVGRVVEVVQALKKDFCLSTKKSPCQYCTSCEGIDEWFGGVTK